MCAKYKESKACEQKKPVQCKAESVNNIFIVQCMHFTVTFDSAAVALVIASSSTTTQTTQSKCLSNAFDKITFLKKILL